MKRFPARADDARGTAGHGRGASESPPSLRIESVQRGASGTAIVAVGGSSLLLRPSQAEAFGFAPARLAPGVELDEDALAFSPWPRRHTMRRGKPSPSSPEPSNRAICSGSSSRRGASPREPSAAPSTGFAQRHPLRYPIRRSIRGLAPNETARRARESPRGPPRARDRRRPGQGRRRGGPGAGRAGFRARQSGRERGKASGSR